MIPNCIQALSTASLRLMQLLFLGSIVIGTVLSASCIREADYTYLGTDTRAVDQLPEDAGADTAPDVCRPLSCEELELACGSGDDGCGGTAICGDCSDGKECLEGSCECRFVDCLGACCQEEELCCEGMCGTPRCDGRICGDDGCGGSCGQCPDNYACTADGECIAKCTDLCEAVECGSAGLDNECFCGDCDDSNVCTADSCNQGECVHIYLDQTCDDGDPCTVGDTCEEGVCHGVEKSCVDSNPCTDDSCINGTCLHEYNTDSCDDSNMCTLGDKCSDGVCSGSLNPCDDSNPCSLDICDPSTGNCVNNYEQMDGSTCDDGNPCTINTVCVQGLCLGELLPPEQLIVEQCICNDSDDCLELEDSSICNGRLHCYKASEDQQGVCLIDSQTILVCNDSHVCTTDSCDPVVGCVFQPNNGQCNDNNVCTDDACMVGTGCTYQANSASCDDSNACTVEDFCEDSQCHPGEALDCDDDNPCTYNFCSSDSGCKVQMLNGQSCNDGDICTVGDSCNQGNCISGPQDPCEDDLPCTLDSCVPGTGCVHEADSDLCDDDQPCTEDVCDPVSGCQYTAYSSVCEDGNPCTDRACIPFDGCVTSFNTAACDDGDFCTVGDVCNLGHCSPGSSVHPDCMDLDFDHDGVCPNSLCRISEEDTCPTIWNPDNSPEACPVLDGSYLGNREIILSQADTGSGNSSLRRSREPISVPLWNGIVDDSIIGLWTLDGTSSDASLYLNHGTNEGAFPQTGVYEDPSGAMGFDGSGSQITVSSNSIAWGKAVTLMTWVRLDRIDQPQTLLEAWGLAMNASQVYGINIYFQPDGNGSGDFIFTVHTPTPATYELSAGLPPDWTPGEWIHVAQTFDSTRHVVYLNGAIMAQTQALGTSFGAPVDTQVCFGHRFDNNPDNQQHLTGALDEVLLASRAMTFTELHEYYNSKVPFGIEMVPGSQRDFDDIRLVEKMPGQTSGVQVPFEVSGPHPHSDSPCPQAMEPELLPDAKNLCGVEAYWRLDGDLEDLVNPDRSSMASINGAASSTGRMGRLSTALSFAGSSHQYADLGYNLSGLGRDDSFTVEFWMLTSESTLTSQGILGAAAVDGAAFAFFLNRACQGCSGAGKLQWQMTGASGTSFWLESSATIEPGRWYHVSGTYTPESLKLYVDGKLQSSRTNTLPLGDGISTPSSWSIGKVNGDTSSGMFKGKLDELLVHNIEKSSDYLSLRSNPATPTIRFLASTEVSPGQNDDYPWLTYNLRWGNSEALLKEFVATDMTQQQLCGNLLSPCLGYSGWWRFEEGLGQTAMDSSGLGASGNITNASWVTGTMETTALNFNSTTSLVEVPDLPPLESLTIEFAVMMKSSQSSGAFSIPLLEKGSEGQYFKVLMTSEGLVFSLNNDQYQHSSTAALPVNGWFTGVVILRQGEGSTLYLDEGLDSVLEGNPELADQMASLLIGGPGEGTSYFNGSVDFLRLMSRPLSEDEFIHFPLAEWELGPLN